MIFVLLILVPIIALILWKEKLFLKIKAFLKGYKVLIILEIVIITGLFIFNIFNNTVVVMEKNPHSDEVLKSIKLKEGEVYIYKTADFKSMLQDLKKHEINVKENENTIKIENIGFTKIKFLVNGIKKDYKYGTGFSYYGFSSCECGTPIVFERMLINIIRIVTLGIIIIDLFLGFNSSFCLWR